MQHIRPTTGLLDDRDEDWRDTLFYWHGRVTWVGGERNVVSWRGSWLSTVASHAPPAADFSSSFNFFELNFDVDPMRARQFATGDMDLRALLQLSGEFRGHYLMEPPDGAGYRRAYRDDAHEFEFDDRIEDPPPEVGASDPLPPRAPQQIPGAPLLNVFVVPPPPRTPRQPGPYVLCAARGRNEFGTFVALGHARRFRSGAEDAVELTLARRYVRDDDSRLRWPLRDILRGVQAPIRVSPWEHSLPWRLQGDVIAEQQRLEAERQRERANHVPQPFAAQPLAHHTDEYRRMMDRKRTRD